MGQSKPAGGLAKLLKGAAGVLILGATTAAGAAWFLAYADGTAPEHGREIYKALMLASLFCACLLGLWWTHRLNAAPAPMPPADASTPPDWAFRSLAENDPNHIAGYDEGCRLLYVNPSLEKSMLGPAAQKLGCHPWEILPYSEKDMENVKALVAAALAAGKAGEIEVCLKDVGDGIRHHQIRFVTERDGDGETLGLLGIAEDVTERRRLVESLSDSHHFLDKIIDNIANPIFVKDRQHRWLHLNEACCRLIGGKRENLIGKSDFDYFPPDEAEIFWRGDEIVFESGCEFAQEEELTDPSGRKRHIFTRKTLFTGKDGQPVLVAMIADITEQRQMENALLENRKTLQEAQRIAHIGSWKFDFANQRLECSDETFRILELEPATANLSCEAFLALLAPRDRQLVEQRYAQSIARRQPCDLEYRLVMPDGRVKHVHGRCETLYAEDGTPLRSIGTLQDVTASKETARQLEESNRLLKELSAHRESAREEEQRRIARNLHEELGQLLTSLRMRLSVMKVKFAPTLPEIEDSIAPLLGLVDQSIDGLRRTVADLRPKLLDLGIVPALEYLAEDFTAHTGIECNLHIDEGIALPDERGTALYRIVQEALTNVARHAQGTQVGVTLEFDADDLLLTIVDDGQGIDLEANRSKTKSFGLLGMKERSLMLGGEIDIRPGAAGGTEIVLRMPA